MGINAERDRAGDSGSSRHWTLNLMRSAAAYGSFSEYWIFASYLGDRVKGDGCDDAVHFLPYAEYGARAERFFDDGSDAALFTTELCTSLAANGRVAEFTSPSSGFSP